MKRIYTIFAAIAAVVSLNSCSDYLGVKPRGYDVASKVEHYEGLIYGTDMFYLQVSFPYMCFETYSDQNGLDMAYSEIGSYITNGYKWEADIYREDQNCGEWNSFTTFLYNTNKVIAEVLDAEDGTPEQRLAVQAEARVIRAFCTFMMSQFFGKVPIIDRASTQDTSYPLSSVEEVHAFVLSELEEAVPQLREDQEHFMRVFKASGHGVYGKILFMMGRYHEASIQIDQAFSSLESSSPWNGLHDYNALMDGNEMKFVSYNNLNTERLFLMGGMPRLYEAVYGGLYNQLLFGVKNELMEKYFYDKADTRMAFYSSIATGVSAYHGYSPRQQYAANLTSNNIFTNYGLDLSELYTMQAECLAREGRTDEAAKLLVELRRHRMEPGHEALPSEIVTSEQMTVFAFDERMREQLGFGASWFDMKRLWNDPLFQDLKQYYVHPAGDVTYTLTEDRLYMKIPPTVLAWHPEYAEN